MQLISVIIPNYNHARFLDKRLKSIFNQTYPDFEIIILDDASTDNSKEIFNKYREHPKISQFIINSENSGNTFSQWIVGIKEAKGDFIYIAESDDFCEPTLLETLIKPFVENTSLSLSICQSIMINEKDKVIGKTSSDFLEEIIDGRTYIKSKLFGDNSIINSGMVLFKKANIIKSLDEILSFNYVGDWMMWILACDKGDIFISGKYLNYFLRHEKAISNTAILSGRDFEESNNVFNHVLSTYRVNQKQLNTALKTRIKIFRKQISFNSKKSEILKKQLFLLHPKMKKYYYKSVSIDMVNKIFTSSSNIVQFIISNFISAILYTRR